MEFINSITTDIIEHLNVSLPRLEVYGNPCCKQAKYRDIAIGASPDNFHVLDDAYPEASADCDEKN